mmetsp:Transcript_15778/g.19771  ORF Transcript_15778/g.19771 Transcript_15778/m.19771 type:complete len:80 (-) Transcript_15778:3-242(-)
MYDFNCFLKLKFQKSTPKSRNIEFCLASLFIFLKKGCLCSFLNSENRLEHQILLQTGTSQNPNFSRFICCFFLTIFYTK